MDGACGTCWADKKNTQHLSEKLRSDVGKFYVYERYIELEFKQIKYQGVD